MKWHTGRNLGAVLDKDTLLALYCFTKLLKRINMSSVRCGHNLQSPSPFYELPSQLPATIFVCTFPTSTASLPHNP